MVTKNDRDMLARLIGFFVVLTIIFLFVHFCMPEAKGQTPPMNPVNIDWSVNPVAIYLDIFDTYYQIQRLSAESDTVYLTIDTLAAHKDTLHSRIDSLNSQADTLALEIDTLRLRIDSMQTNRDSIFFAYDAAGDQEILTMTTNYINLDTEVFEDAIYVHATDDYAVAVNSTGRYEITYSVGLIITDPAITICYLRTYSGSWSTVGGSTMVFDASGATRASSSRTVQCQLSSGDSLAIQVYNGTSATVDTELNGAVTLGIKKLH